MQLKLSSSSAPLCLLQKIAWAQNVAEEKKKEILLTLKRNMTEFMMPVGFRGSGESDSSRIIWSIPVLGKPDLTWEFL